MAGLCHDRLIAAVDQSSLDAAGIDRLLHGEQGLRGGFALIGKERVLFAVLVDDKNFRRQHAFELLAREFVAHKIADDNLEAVFEFISMLFDRRRIGLEPIIDLFLARPV